MSPVPSLIDHLAGRAHEILVEWAADEWWPVLQDAAGAHLVRFASATGLPVIAALDFASDTGPLLAEGARALAVNAAAVLHRGADLAGQLPVATPVEEATHALTAQVDLLRGITDRSGVRIVARTPVRPLEYRRGCLTHDVYDAAWGTPPARYWLAHDVVAARRRELERRYRSVGLRPGDGHRITFADLPAGHEGGPR